MELSKAYIFGLTLSLTIGPISLLIVQRAITKGLKSALVTSLALALGDGTIAFVAFSIGASILLFISAHKLIVEFLSGIILLALAINVFWMAFMAFKRNKTPTPAQAHGKDFLSAYLLTVHNPLAIAIFLGFIGNISHLESLFSVVTYAAMVFLGSCTGKFAIGFVSYNLRRVFKSSGAIFTMNVISSIVIAIFAVMNLIKLF